MSESLHIGSIFQQSKVWCSIVTSSLCFGLHVNICRYASQIRTKHRYECICLSCPLATSESIDYVFRIVVYLSRQNFISFLWDVQSIKRPIEPLEPRRTPPLDPLTPPATHPCQSLLNCNAFIICCSRVLSMQNCGCCSFCGVR